MIFPGNYTQYRIQQKIEEENKKENLPTKIEVSAQKLEESPAQKKKIGFKEKREFELLEKEIADLEAEKSQIENELCDANLGYETLSMHSKRIGEITSLLEEKEMRWLELSELM